MPHWLSLYVFCFLSMERPVENLHVNALKELLRSRIVSLKGLKVKAHLVAKSALLRLMTINKFWSHLLYVCFIVSVCLTNSLIKAPLFTSFLRVEAILKNSPAVGTGERAKIMLIKRKLFHLFKPARVIRILLERTKKNFASVPKRKIWTKCWMTFPPSLSILLSSILKTLVKTFSIPLTTWSWHRLSVASIFFFIKGYLHNVLVKHHKESQTHLLQGSLLSKPSKKWIPT